MYSTFWKHESFENQMVHCRFGLASQPENEQTAQVVQIDPLTPPLEQKWDQLKCSVFLTSDKEACTPPDLLETSCPRSRDRRGWILIRIFEQGGR